MSRVGFEPTIQVFEQAKMIDVLDRPDTVIGLHVLILLEINSNNEVYTFCTKNE
jgi:hypothetical protein